MFSNDRKPCSEQQRTVSVISSAFFIIRQIVYSVMHGQSRQIHKTEKTIAENMQNYWYAQDEHRVLTGNV